MTSHLYTPAKTAEIKEKIINNYALPIVTKVLNKHPSIESVYFAVAQYWSDEARDEVHNYFLCSELDVPNWEAFAKCPNVFA